MIYIDLAKPCYIWYEILNLKSGMLLLFNGTDKRGKIPTDIYKIN